jgi:hypothetical protein
MDKRSLNARLSDALSTFPQSKLEILGDLLDNPELRRAFAKLIEHTVEIYAGGNHKHYRYEAAGPASDAELSLYQYNFEDRLRYSLFTVLSDKNIFPTVNDVVSAVNHFFGINLEPSKLRKASRRTISSRVWSRLMALPRRERTTKLRRFFQSVEQMDPHRTYRELFRILSRSE